MHPLFLLRGEGVFAKAGDLVEHRVHKLVVVEDGRARFDVVDFGVAVGLFFPFEEAEEGALKGAEDGEGALFPPDDEGEEVAVEGAADEAGGAYPVAVGKVDEEGEAEEADDEPGGFEGEGEEEEELGAGVEHHPGDHDGVDGWGGAVEGAVGEVEGREGGESGREGRAEVEGEKAEGMGALDEGGAKDVEEVHVESELDKAIEGEGFNKEVGEELPEMEPLDPRPGEGEEGLERGKEG